MTSVPWRWKDRKLGNYRNELGHYVLFKENKLPFLLPSFFSSLSPSLPYFPTLSLLPFLLFSQLLTLLSCTKETVISFGLNLGYMFWWDWQYLQCTSSPGNHPRSPQKNSHCIHALDQGPINSTSASWEQIMPAVHFTNPSLEVKELRQKSTNLLCKIQGHIRKTRL